MRACASRRRAPLTHRLRFAFYLSDKTDLFSGSCLGIGDVCGNASYGLYFTSATPLDTR